MMFQDEADCYQHIFDQHQTVMLIIDPATGTISHANLAAAAYYGWPMDGCATWKCVARRCCGKETGCSARW
jgi:hypothetical protein